MTGKNRQEGVEQMSDLILWMLLQKVALQATLPEEEPQFERQILALTKLSNMVPKTPVSRVLKFKIGETLKVLCVCVWGGVHRN